MKKNHKYVRHAHYTISMFKHIIKLEMEGRTGPCHKLELPTEGKHLVLIQPVDDSSEELKELFEMSGIGHFLVLEGSFFHVFHTFPDEKELKAQIENLASDESIDLVDCIWGPVCFNILDGMICAFEALLDWQDDHRCENVTTSGEDLKAAMALFSQATAANVKG